MFYSNLKFENPQTGESKTFAIAVNQTGEGAPHGGTPGNPGMLYMNTVNGDLYKCSSVKQETGVHVWEKVWSSSWNAKEADPTVFDWAKKEMFNKNGFTDPANRNSFILIDGVEYYRYSASAQSFEYHNPYPYPGSVRITMRVSPQYENATGSKIIAEYSDGTSELIGTATGETFVFTTPADKTLSYIRGNYDKETWQLIDMSVMSLVAMYNIGLPIADVNAAGGVKADPVESTDTQPVRIGADGKLYTAPGGGDSGWTGESTSGNWERVHFFEVPTADTIANDTTNITWIADENNNVYGFELDTNENGEPLNYKSLFFKVRQGGCSEVNTADKSADIYINDVKIGAWAKAQVNLNNRTGKVKIYPNGSGYELEYAGLSAFSAVNNWTSSPMLSNGPSHADGTAGKVDGRIKKIKLEFSPEYYIPGGYLVGIWGVK